MSSLFLWPCSQRFSSGHRSESWRRRIRVYSKPSFASPKQSETIEIACPFCPMRHRTVRPARTVGTCGWNPSCWLTSAEGFKVKTSNMHTSRIHSQSNRDVVPPLPCTPITNHQEPRSLGLQVVRMSSGCANGCPRNPPSEFCQLTVSPLHHQPCQTSMQTVRTSNLEPPPVVNLKAIYSILFKTGLDPKRI